MTDTVLQSFCERCGTRYTFTEQDTRRESGLSKLGRSLGLRSAPRPTGEPTVATALPTHDPFRATFHFCLECRQYTCQSCWNADAGYCQTCYPLAEVDLRAAELEASAEARFTGSQTSSLAAPVATASAWPTTDLDRAARVSSTSGAFPPPSADADEGPAPSADAQEGQAEAEDAPPFADPWSGRESIAASILRSAGSPTSIAAESPSAPTPGTPPPEQADADAAPATDVWRMTAAAPAAGRSPTGAVEADFPPQDPWRGIVFSEDEARPVESTANELAPPPQPDPDLPWLAPAAAADVVGGASDESASTAQPPEATVTDDRATNEVTSVHDRDATDVAVEPPALDQAVVTGAEIESDVDHRGWIAASTVAAGTGWSAPMRSPQDEDRDATRPDHGLGGDAVSGDAAQELDDTASPVSASGEVAADGTSMPDGAASDRDIAIIDLEHEVRARESDVVWMSGSEASEPSAIPEPATAEATDAVADAPDFWAPTSAGAAPAGSTVPWPSADTRTSGDPTPVASDTAGSSERRDESRPSLAPAAGLALAAAAPLAPIEAGDDEIPDGMAQAVGQPPSDETPAVAEQPPSDGKPPTRSPEPAPVAAETRVPPALPADPFALPGDQPVGPADPWTPPGPVRAPVAPPAQPMTPPLPAPVSAASAPSSSLPFAPPPAAPPSGPSVAPASPLALPHDPAAVPPTQTPASMPLGWVPSATHVLRPAEHPVAPPPPPAAPPLMLAPQPPPLHDVPAPHPAFVAPPPATRLPAPPPVAAPPPAAGVAQAGAGAKARPCQNCALPLSAKARFCRRCGAQQAA